MPSSSAAKHQYASGSMLSWKRPTVETVSVLFGGSSHKEQEFNHKSVGLTNPCLHIAVPEEEQKGMACSMDAASSVTLATLPVSTRDVDAAQDSWWPETACSTSACRSWRLLTFRRRVGRGAACYQAVRDAALQWEFSSLDNSKGIVAVSPPAVHSARGYSVHHHHASMQQDDNVYDPVAAAGSILKIGPGRRFVTYSKSGFRFRLGGLYAMNPVSVVYDVVDERGPGTTFTSTAYATEKGHWLRGEERVTVALRDTGHVDVEIVSFSKPAPGMGKLVWPVIGGMQQGFFQQQLNALQRVAQGSDSPTATTAIHPSILRIQ